MGKVATRRRVVLAMVAATSVVALVLLVPRTAGTSWAAVDLTVARLTAPDLVALTALWCAGLWAHSFVLTASLPGLTTIRALTLNLTGSAVANVVPLGGAAGVGLNFTMARAWGFSSQSLRTFTAVSNLLNVAAKLVVGALGLGLVLVAGTTIALPAAATQAIVGSLLVALPLLTAVLLSARVTRGLGAVTDHLVALGARLAGSGMRTGLRTTLPALRLDTGRLLRGRWRRLSLGMTSYLVLQGALLWTCLHVLGSGLGPVVVVAGLAVERLLTMVPITPAGAGVVEAGTVAALVALGADPATAAAAVLVYRGFTFLLEIPVGGVGIGLWLVRRHLIAWPWRGPRRGIAQP